MQTTIKSMPYEPDSSAHCPKCDMQVRCHMLEYVKTYSDWHLTFWHKECNTEWRQNL